MRINWIKPFLAIVIMIGLFYWYEWMPRDARIACSNAADKVVKERENLNISDGVRLYNYSYTSCLKRRGIQ